MTKLHLEKTYLKPIGYPDVKQGRNKMKKPNFRYERQLWRKGFEIVVGVDEVGRGAFAGPIVAAAAVFPKPEPEIKINLSNILSLGINDSKLLKSKEREKLVGEIKKYVLAWSVAEIPVSVINRQGMGKASAQVMRKAVASIIDKITRSRKNVNKEKTTLFVLVDGFHVKYIPGIGLGKQRGIIGGDQKSISIAAASILAKVYRDNLMKKLTKLTKEYPLYGWGRNKGYGTREHQKAIKKYGITKLHRKGFIATWQNKLQISKSQITNPK